MDDDDGELREAGGDGKLNASEDDANDTTIQTTNFDDTFMVWLIFFGRGGMDVVVPLPQTSARGRGGVDGWITDNVGCRQGLWQLLYSAERALRRAPH